MRGFYTLSLAISTSFGLARGVSLGAAGTFGALSFTTITNTGSTNLVGDIGTFGTSITGFPPGIYTGSEYLGSSVVIPLEDAATAYGEIAALGGTITTGDLGGQVLSPGVYKYPSSAELTGTLTLKGSGSPDDAWYFQIGSTLTTAGDSKVVITEGGQPCNVFWQVGSSATIGIGSVFAGNILAETSITATTSASFLGGLFALNGAVTLDTNLVEVQLCSSSTTTSSSSTTTSSLSATTSSLSTTTSSFSSSTTVASSSVASSSPILSSSPLFSSSTALLSSLGSISSSTLSTSQSSLATSTTVSRLPLPFEKVFTGKLLLSTSTSALKNSTVTTTSGLIRTTTVSVLNTSTVSTTKIYTTTISITVTNSVCLVAQTITITALTAMCNELKSQGFPTPTGPEATSATMALVESTVVPATNVTTQPSETYLQLPTTSGARRQGISKGLGLIFIIFVILF